jgi:hypothetical protein
MEYPPNTYTRNYSLECLTFIDDGSSSTKDIDTFAHPKFVHNNNNNLVTKVVDLLD